ncbi:MAG: hypothetical protein FJ220_04880, partial [Kiritimatiellaceae bacterium]|nr:hypothetical protein [Kiritimatiellaceae bacterium]
MIKLVNKTKTAGLLAAIAAFSVATVGCSKETPKEVTSPAEPVQSAAVAESTEAPTSITPDLFEQPIQPNPLAPAATDIVLTVDGKGITHGEIMQGVQMSKMQLSRRVPREQLEKMTPQIYKRVTDDLIANILLTQAAEKSSLTVSDEELDKEVATIEANAPEGMTLKDALAENKLDFDEWKSDLRKQLLVRKLAKEKTDGVAEVSVGEVNKFYEENIESFKIQEGVAASHILLAFSEDDTDETKAQKKKDIEKIRSDLLAGADFAEVAKEKSDCPSKENGGSLGMFSHGQMVPEFEAAAFTQEIGTVGEVVETQFGYHLIKVAKRQEAGVRPLSEVKDQLQEYLQGKA